MLLTLFQLGGGTAGAEPPVDVGNAVESFIPIVFASRLDRIKHLNYATLLADAIAEADGAAVWAKRNWARIVRLWVDRVPL